MGPFAANGIVTGWDGHTTQQSNREDISKGEESTEAATTKIEDRALWQYALSYCATRADTCSHASIFLAGEFG